MPEQSRGSSWVHSWEIAINCNQLQPSTSIYHHPHHPYPQIIIIIIKHIRPASSFSSSLWWPMPANLNLEYNRSSTSLVTAGLLRQTCKKTDSIDHCYLGKPRKQWREVSARARRSWWRGGNRDGRWRSPGRSCDLAATLCPSTWSVSLLRTSHFWSRLCVELYFHFSKWEIQITFTFHLHRMPTKTPPRQVDITPANSTSFTHWEKRKCKTVLAFRIYLNDIEGIGVDHRSDPKAKYLKARRLLSSLSSPAINESNNPNNMPGERTNRTSHSLYTNSKRNDDHW